MVARALAWGKHSPGKGGADDGSLRRDSFKVTRRIVAIILLLSALMHVHAADTDATVSILFGAYPDIRVLTPNGGELINGTITIVGDIIDVEGNDDIVSVNFSAYRSPCYGSRNTTELGFGTNTSQRNWSLSWNTSRVADSNDWFVTIEALDSLALLTGYVPSDDSDQRFVINNIDQEPNWTEFKNNLSTNLTALNNDSVLNDWIYVTNLVIAKPDDGLINWTDQTLNVDNADLDSYIEISQGEIKLDDCGLVPFTSADAVVHFYNLSLVNPIVLKDAEVCTSCTTINYTHTNNRNGTLIFSVEDWASRWSWDFVTYTVKDDLVLDIWDQNDTAKPYANLIVYRNNNVRFFANYTSTGGALPESSETFCQIRFNTTLPWTSYADMTYNRSTKLFEYNRTFSSLGNVAWSVLCDSTLLGYYQLTDSDTVTISNRPPVLLSNYPDISMFEDTTAIGFDLDAYFYDPDSDALNYTALEPGNIRIAVDSTTHVPAYAPDPNFAGTRTSYFTATDTYGASATSNTYTITVIDVAEAAAPTTDTGGAGGAGPVWCTPKWNCTEWEECKFKLLTLGTDFLEGFTGYQTRVCIDRSDCGYDYLKPDEVKGCFYKPTCFDLIKNQGEAGVDCGGPCPPCPSCFDRIRNQGEAGVDCGGPCPACPTCFDGMMNQGEEGIDCGGPCPSCEVEVIKKRGEVMEEVYQWLIWLMLSMVLVAVLMSMYYSKPYVDKFSEWLLLRMERFTEVPVARPTLLELELRTLARLQKLDEQLDTVRPEESSAEYSRIMREFFRTASGLTFEFTYEELLNEFRKLRIGAVTLRALRAHFGKLSNIEFGKEALPRTELHGELIAARRQVQAVVRSLAKAEAPTREAFKEQAEKKRKLTAQKLSLQFNRMLLQAERSLEQGQTDAAKALYNQLREQYARLPEEERKQVLKRIKELYTKLSGRKPT